MSQTSRIMVIDDDLTLLKAVESILTEQEYDVCLAKSGNQAIDILNNGYSPDLILLDITMPVMDGYEAYKHIKEIQNVPIIFLTGREDAETELKCLCLGAIDYVTKPFVDDILVARIRNHLSQIRGAQPDSQEAVSLAVKFDEEKLMVMEELLTEAEFKVGKMISLGYTNQEIAEEFSYSYGYVKKIVYRIFDKLGVCKRNEVRPFFVE